MTDNRIRSLANSFRKKIDWAKSKRLFEDTMLGEFPEQCCGPASELLAEFLWDHGIETLWISGMEYETHESHAWLVVKDDRINSPRACFDDVPKNIMDTLGMYGDCAHESIREATCYDEQDIENGLIIDITGDQFGEIPVYVGYMDRFHERFDFVSAYEHSGLYDDEFIKLYESILACCS